MHSTCSGSCDVCTQRFMLTKDDIRTTDLFPHWWKYNTEQFSDTSITRGKEDLYQMLSSSILGYLATLYSQLPGVIDDCSTRISKVRLTPQQQSIVY